MMLEGFWHVLIRANGKFFNGYQKTPLLFFGGKSIIFELSRSG